MEEYKWNECDLNTAENLIKATTTPGQVFPLEISSLPSGIQRMPGLKEAYISGFVDAKAVGPDFSGYAEFTAIRYEGTTGKGYNFGLAVSGDGTVYFSGRSKYKFRWESTAACVPPSKASDKYYPRLGVESVLHQRTKK